MVIDMDLKSASAFITDLHKLIILSIEDEAARADLVSAIDVFEHRELMVQRLVKGFYNGDQA